jgi:hypothetical protein
MHRANSKYLVHSNNQGVLIVLKLGTFIPRRFPIEISCSEVFSLIFVQVSVSVSRAIKDPNRDSHADIFRLQRWLFCMRLTYLLLLPKLNLLPPCPGPQPGDYPRGL